MNTKTQLKIGLTTDEDALVSAVAEARKTSKSTAGRDMMMAGYDTMQTAELIIERLDVAINKLFKRQEELENRFMNVMMLTNKNTGAIKAILKSVSFYQYKENFDEIKKIVSDAEQAGINKSFTDLNIMKKENN